MLDRTPKCIKQILTDLKTENDSTTRGLQRSTYNNEHNIQTEDNKGTVDLNNTIGQMDLTDIN